MYNTNICPYYITTPMINIPIEIISKDTKVLNILNSLLKLLLPF